MRLPHSLGGHTCQLCGDNATALGTPTPDCETTPAICAASATNYFPAPAADATYGNPDLTLARMTAAYSRAQ